MIRIRLSALVRGLAITACAVALGFAATSSVEAGGFFGRRGRGPAPAVLVRTQTTVPTVAPTAAPGGSLGNFYETPYITSRGNFPAGGGWSPFGEYGDTNLSLYGPLSSFRSISAPVQVYSRGYDGRLRVQDGTATSTPNLPSLSPIVYPTRSNTSFYGRRPQSTPPQWDDATNWIDQN